MSKYQLNNKFEDALAYNGGVLWKLAGVAFGLFLLYFLLFRTSVDISFVFAIIPLTIVGTILIINYYRRIFYVLFCSHFLILIASSIADIPLGIITFCFNVFIIVLLMLISVYRNTTWKDSWNGMLLVYAIWGLFCVAELGNPNTVVEAWLLAVTHYVAYPLICAILVPLTIRRYKNVEWLLILWAIFILLAAAKGFYQKTHGFNAREQYFLFVLGGEKTHIIWSGIRYFSFFTDAANYGVHMAMGALAFALSALYVKNIWLKIFFGITVIAGIYGFMISGTRAAMAIPIAGLFYYVFLGKNWRAVGLGVGALLVLFVFFRFTMIGQGNEYIRKMRSAFNPSTDASYQLRVANREQMKLYMATKPFGYGLGLGGKGERFHPKEHIPIPPDSWLINVWMDTGSFGFALYIVLYGVLFAWCSWILMFKLQSKRLRNLLMAWLCTNGGFFVAAYANDVMQYPNMIVLYTGFALCFAGPVIERSDRTLQKEIEVEQEQARIKRLEKEKKKRYI
ncbi:MAG: O-antigen ligase family protein [Prevotellaceae bacterium]|jgi:hypothetical protein|nr:O-antigen ligase family protein [Prevotellaceae bacterium]